MDLTDIFATFPPLETERCILRAIAPEDAPDIFHIMSDARVTRYLARLPMTSPEEAEKQVQKYLTVYQEQEGIPWAIIRRGQKQVIGTCVFWNLIKAHFRAEIGYVLSPEWWGQGVITEVASAMLTLGFTQMGLHSVEAQMDPENTGSRRVLEKLGFAQEGYFRENYYDTVKEKFTDTAVFSLLRQTWMSRTEG